MTCIKTGAKVHFLNYDRIVSADIYRVSDAIIIRVTGDVEIIGWTPWSLQGKQFKVTHEVQFVNTDFVRVDLGIFVIDNSGIREVS